MAKLGLLAYIRKLTKLIYLLLKVVIAYVAESLADVKSENGLCDGLKLIKISHYTCSVYDGKINDYLKIEIK